MFTHSPSPLNGAFYINYIRAPLPCADINISICYTHITHSDNFFLLYINYIGAPIVRRSPPRHSPPQTFTTSDVHHLRRSPPQTFTTSDIHHPQCKIRRSPPQTFTTPDVHHLRRSPPQTFTTPFVKSDVHHPRRSPPPL